jgi:transcriptional regulator with XRE-family HTH domain
MTRQSKSLEGLPEEVAARLRLMGDDIRNARKSRRMSMAELAGRALTNRETLRRLEKGEPGVSMGTLAHVLWVLGLEANLGNLASLEADAHRRLRLEQELPKRIRRRQEGKYDF